MQAQAVTAPVDNAWPELISALRARHPFVQSAGDDELRLILAFQDIRIPIRLRRVVAYGVTHVVIAAEIGPLGCLEPWAALRHNATLAAGAVAIEQRATVVRAVVPADGGTLQRLHRLAAEAAQIKRTIQVRPAVGSTELFEGY
jgi:hypothetical protein